MYSRPVGCISVKCLIECRSWLGMIRPSLEVDFWFISIVIMCLMDPESYNKFWAVAGIFGQKSALNSADVGTGMLGKIPRCREVGL